MPETIMPVFDQTIREGDLIGRLLAGYGELELERAQCVMAANGEDVDMVIKSLFTVRGELKRIKKADSMMASKYEAVGLSKPYARAMKGMDFCRTLRNQYAHCNWYHTASEGLCFIDLETVAKSNKLIKQVTKHRRPVNVALLELQEGYFKYVQECFWYLGEAYRLKAKIVRGGPLWTRPKIVARPRRYNVKPA